MSISDEKERTKVAKKFAKSVRDSKSNSYADIVNISHKNHAFQAQDSKPQKSARERSQSAVDAIANAGKKMSVQNNK